MCVNSDRSDGAETTIINPQTGDVETIAALNYAHTHILPDGTVITHSHPTYGCDHSHEYGHSPAHTPHHAYSHPAHSPHRADRALQSRPHGSHLEGHHSPPSPSEPTYHHLHSNGHSQDFNHPPSPLSPLPYPLTLAASSEPIPSRVSFPLSATQLHAPLPRITPSQEHHILARNDLIAAQNRGWFKGRHTLALNLVSSPGSGKTTLLTRTINDLMPEIPFSVIGGDQATTNDASRIQETGCKVVQINTGTGCCLEPAMVERGLQILSPPPHSIVMIENVGNLVCPALVDLGEQAKVVVLSVTEGEDKPVKYPYMFQASQVMVLTKIDLLPYVQFEIERCLEYARWVNPGIQIFQVSAVTGAGLDAWYDWLRQARQ